MVQGDQEGSEMTKYTIKSVVYTLVCLVFMLASAASHATTVIMQGTYATGIKGLDIGLPTYYDISFELVTGTASQIIILEPCAAATPCDLFAGNQAGSLLAATAIAEALAGAGADRVAVAGPTGTFSRGSLKIAYDDTCKDGPDTGICVTELFYNGSSWLPPLDKFIFNDNADVIFARFTPALHTPLPPAAYLFASGLAMLGWMRRRRRAS